MNNFFNAAVVEEYDKRKFDFYIIHALIKSKVCQKFFDMNDFLMQLFLKNMTKENLIFI